MTTNPPPAEFLADKATCRDGRDFALQFETMADVWEACERPEWMFWILQRTTPLTKEQSVQMSVAFSEPHLDCVPEGEVRPRKAIEAAKKWLKEPTEENRIAAAAARFYAANASFSSASVSASAAAAACSFASAAAAARTDAHALAAARAAARAALDKRKLCEIIREAIANPFK